MKLNKNIKFLCCLVVFSFVLTKDFSFNSNVFFGYDTNPLRLSANEINNLNFNPQILGNADEVESPYLGFKMSLKKKMKKQKIQLSFNVKSTFYTLNKDKNNYNFSFNFKKSFGKYRNFIFDYFLMPDFYLREYEDRDLYIVCEDDLNDCLLSSHFSIEKVRLYYTMPIKPKKSSIKIGIIHERQIFDQNFTEFDLKIIGPVIEFKSKHKNINYSIYHERLEADNYTYIDGSFSTAYADRSYLQNRYKISLDKKISKKIKYGFVLDVYERENTSNIFGDNLHKNRKHVDLTLSSWIKFNSNKVTLALRKRQTESPYDWVTDLKTFERINVTFTRYFKKINF